MMIGRSVVGGSAKRKMKRLAINFQNDTTMLVEAKALEKVSGSM